MDDDQERVFNLIKTININRKYDVVIPQLSFPAIYIKKLKIRKVSLPLDRFSSNSEFNFRKKISIILYRKLSPYTSLN